ncbi:MAG: LPS-assembly protein LptD [Tannerella sp.]|jgi:hypothetical protein|nr:LPS-assembly protein LptD [Tannerella sp.]
MFPRRKIVSAAVLLLSLWGLIRLQAQDANPPANSGLYPAVSQTPDTLQHAVQDTTTAVADTVAVRKSSLEATVEYKSKDSIVWTSGNKVYLFGDGDVKYQQIQLQSELIRVSMDSSTVFATYGTDSTGMEFGFPLFVNGEQQFESREMRYNFKTRKAYAKSGLTQQGEGFLTANETKKMPDNSMNMHDGMYTTCDEHDHPHFYIKLSKFKVRPGKDIVSGPVYLVIEDVPLPLGLPFAFFPFSSTYSSGIIMPTYGDEMQQGFFLRDGGYYFALSDYVDLALTGEIYTKGSWGVNARSSYRKRYKFSGSFAFSYQETVWGEKGFDDYQKSKAFKINLTHTQDAKANPYRTVSASVNLSTNQYDRNQIKEQYSQASTENNKGSSVSISQRFPNSPFSMSATMNINTRSIDSSVYVSLPNLTLTLSRIFPFKRKNAVGQERWYEKISASYSGSLQNSITAKEKDLFRQNLVRDWKNAMDHNIPVSATYTAFGYLNISPSFRYHERWYTNRVVQEYDTAQSRLAPVDTTYGFYRVYDYGMSVSASTTLYGDFIPWRIFGDRIRRIRHRMEPSVSLNYTPDFGDPRYGFWKNYEYVDRNGQTVTGSYSPFNGQLYGVPGQGEQGSVSFSLDNNVEAKIRSSRDSTGERKVSLIDNLSLGISYNMAAQSFKWSDSRASIRMKLSKSYTLNLAGTFDTYLYDEKGARIDKPRWTQRGKGFGRLRGTSTSFSYTFNNDSFKKWFGGKDTQRTGNTDDGTDDGENATEPPEDPAASTGTRLREQRRNTSGEYDEDGYYLATVPWSFSFNYNLSMAYGEFNPEIREYRYRFTHALSFNGNIQPTKKWNLNFNATYDFDQKKISYMTCNVSRDMHCFRMSASIIPVGYRKSYMFSIAVNSSLLKDLKYQQSSSLRAGQTWY